MKPPLPPSGALASSVPPTFTVPLCMSPSSMIVPSRLLERPRLDDAGVVDHRAEQLSGRLGGQQHMAAVGADQAAVLDQRVHRAGRP